MHLLVADQELAKAGKPRVRDFDYPASSALAPSALRSFFATRPYMRRVAALEHLLLRERAAEAGVSAQVLSCPRSNPSVRLPVLGSNFINATMVVLLVISLMLLTGVVELADIVAEKNAWDVFLYFTSLLTLASGLNDIGFIKWVAESLAKPLASMSPTTAMIMLVALFFWIHYFFSSITSHTAAVLPVVLAVGAAIPGMSVPTLTLLCVYSLGIMGVISPYATGPAPIYYSSGYIGRSQFWRFGLIFGIVFFAGLLVFVLPWLEVIR